MVVEALSPLRIHLRDRTVELQPGQQLSLSDEEGERLLKKVPGKVRAMSPWVIHWDAKGMKNTGLVDFIHVADDGSQWAFVTLLDKGWAAVNMKFARVEM